MVPWCLRGCGAINLNIGSVNVLILRRGFAAFRIYYLEGVCPCGWSILFSTGVFIFDCILLVVLVFPIGNPGNICGECRVNGSGCSEKLHAICYKFVVLFLRSGILSAGGARNESERGGGYGGTTFGAGGSVVGRRPAGVRRGGEFAPAGETAAGCAIVSPYHRKGVAAP